MSAAANPMAAMIAALWERNQPLVRERVALLERAGAGVTSGALSMELRVEAHAAAHKLAGALGMYGRAEAGLIASRMETMLEGDAALDAGELMALAAELRVRLFSE